VRIYTEILLGKTINLSACQHAFPLLITKYFKSLFQRKAICSRATVFQNAEHNRGQGRVLSWSIIPCSPHGKGSDLDQASKVSYL